LNGYLPYSIAWSKIPDYHRSDLNPLYPFSSNTSGAYR